MKGIAKRRASVFVTNLSLLEFRGAKKLLVADVSIYNISASTKKII